MTPGFSDLNRIEREWEVMQGAASVPASTWCLEVLFSLDRANYAYAMEPRLLLDAEVWKSQLLAGKIDLDLGEENQAACSALHPPSRGRSREQFRAFSDHNVYVQLRVDPFYRRVQERRPEFAAAIEPIVTQMLTVKESLCHGDYTPKNMLI